MERIRIRPASVADLPHILHHRRAMFSEMGHQDAGILDRMQATTDTFLRESMPKGAYSGWLAETADGLIVAGGGIAIIPWPGSPDDPTPRRGWILNIYTEPEFRRRGIARQIMETIVVWCRAEGLLAVNLHASEFGRSLYESMGFQPTNEMRLYLWPADSSRLR